MVFSVHWQWMTQSRFSIRLNPLMCCSVMLLLVWFAHLTKGHCTILVTLPAPLLLPPFIITVVETFSLRGKFSHDPQIMLILGCTIEACQMAPQWSERMGPLPTAHSKISLPSTWRKWCGRGTTNYLGVITLNGIHCWLHIPYRRFFTGHL